MADFGIDGFLIWISIGIDVTANRNSNINHAAYLAADGGHDNPNVSLVGGGAGGNSTSIAPCLMILYLPAVFRAVRLFPRFRALRWSEGGRIICASHFWGLPGGCFRCEV